MYHSSAEHERLTVKLNVGDEAIVLVVDVGNYRDAQYVAPLLSAVRTGCAPALTEALVAHFSHFVAWWNITDALCHASIASLPLTFFEKAYQLINDEIEKVYSG